MSRSKYINTFNTTAEYDAYIESALPEFPNVGYDKEAGKVNIRRQSPNDYQVWGTTTATSNFNIKLNNTDVEVTVDPVTGEFYLQGWTGTLTSLEGCFYNNTNITSIKKFALDTSNVTNMAYIFNGCSSLIKINMPTSLTTSLRTANQMFNGIINIKEIFFQHLDVTNVNGSNGSFIWNGLNNAVFDLYINNETTLMRFTNNLSTAGPTYESGTFWQYLPAGCTIHYDNGSQVIIYKWQNNAWTAQS